MCINLSTNVSDKKKKLENSLNNVETYSVAYIYSVRAVIYWKELTVLLLPKKVS